MRDLTGGTSSSGGLTLLVLSYLGQRWQQPDISGSLSAVAGGSGGLTLLFHGESGTGKTMMANAVARHVNKKVLLINFPSLGANEAGEVVRFIFRWATACRGNMSSCTSLQTAACHMQGRHLGPCWWGTMCRQEACRDCCQLNSCPAMARHGTARCANQGQVAFRRTLLFKSRQKGCPLVG